MRETGRAFLQVTMYSDTALLTGRSVARKSNSPLISLPGDLGELAIRLTDCLPLPTLSDSCNLSSVSKCAISIRRMNFAWRQKPTSHCLTRSETGWGESPLLSIISVACSFFVVPDIENRPHAAGLAHFKFSLERFRALRRRLRSILARSFRRKSRLEYYIYQPAANLKPC